MMDDQPNKKVCSICQQVFPATVTHFHRDGSRNDGLSHRCKGCSSERDRKRRKQREKRLPPAPAVQAPAPKPKQVMGKQCSSCGEVRPAEKQYFRADKTKHDGFRTVCKSCEREVQQMRENIAYASAAESLDDKAKKTLEQFIANAADIAPATLASVAEQCLEIFGGATGMASRLFAEMLSAPPGSQTRLRVLQLVLNTVQKAEEKGAINQSSELLTDEELDEKTNEFILKLTNRAQRQKHGNPGNASAV